MSKNQKVEDSEVDAGEVEVAEVKASEVTIPANNPTSEEMAAVVAQLQEELGEDISVRPTSFNFKRTEDKKTGVTTFRETVDLAIPYPEAGEIMKIVEESGKGLDLLLESMASVVNSVARDMLYKDVEATAATFSADKLAWEVIANMPKPQRGGGIPKETWAEFLTDYMTVMPDATGKSVEIITNSCNLFKNKLVSVRTRTDVLEKLLALLSIYADNSAKVTVYEPCLKFLMDKIDTYTNEPADDLLDNLGV